MSEAVPTTVTPEDIVAELGAALGADPSAAIAPWELAAVHVRTFNAPTAVVEWRAPERTLGFIVTATDPQARTFSRTKRFDVVYFSADFTDDEQEKSYQRDHEQITHFVRWLGRWDPK